MTISPRLKSPITRIRGLAEVTLSTAKSPTEFEAMAASTIEECDRLLAMINTMLLISKAEVASPACPMKRSTLRLSSRKRVNFFQAAAEDKGID